MINAKELRNKTALSNIPNKQPGYYKWWGRESELITILDALDVELSDVVSYIEQKDDLYCIYIGIAAKESIRKRIDWHVNDSHTPSRVLNGTLSTLRQSISSIVSQNQLDKDATNEFIDKLKIEWFAIDNEIKSPEAIEKLHAIERDFMAKHLYVLNIQDNKFPQAQSIKKRLSILRKTSKKSR